MSDFTLYHEGTWRDGQIPKVSAQTYVVHYDATNHAYHIEIDQHADFVEWVAQKWEIDVEQRDDDEDASEYLDRIGVSIRKL